VRRHTGAPRSLDPPPPWDPTVALCLGTYGDPRGVGVPDERDIPVRRGCGVQSAECRVQGAGSRVQGYLVLEEGGEDVDVAAGRGNHQRVEAVLVLQQTFVIHFQTSRVSAAHATHRATYCTPCRPLTRAFSGWIRTPPPTCPARQ